MNKIKVMTVFGTRPEAIKMAPLVHALEQNENTESIVCVTAQHREMLDQVLDIFGIRPDYDLNIMQPRQTLATITEKSLHGLDEVLEKAQPDIVLVHGDTSTTFAGALAAFYHKAPVGHVEAGLRTYDKYSPFPEEMNRKLTGQIATLHFAPTPRNRDNLAKEGITDGVFVMGNTVVDAIHMTVKPDFQFRDEQLKTLDFENNRVVLVTAHRRENYGEPMENICRAIAELSEAYPDVHFVYPVHLSPYVRETAEKFLGGNNRIHLIHPLAVAEIVAEIGLDTDAIAAALGPRPVIVVGTARDGRANFAPAAFCTPLSYEPPLVALGLKSTSWSGKAIEVTGHCTLSTVGAEAAEAVLWCGSHSGRDTDKSEGFLCAWTEGGHALPYPQNALSVMEARVRSVTEAGDHRLFILEITEAATRLPKTEEGRLATEPSLLCLEHSVFACARQIS